MSLQAHRGRVRGGRSGMLCFWFSRELEFLVLVLMVVCFDFSFFLWAAGQEQLSTLLPVCKEAVDPIICCLISRKGRLAAEGEG